MEGDSESRLSAQDVKLLATAQHGPLHPTLLSVLRQEHVDLRACGPLRPQDPRGLCRLPTCTHTHMYTHTYMYTHTHIRASQWLSGEESACHCRIHGFDPWVWKIP